MTLVRNEEMSAVFERNLLTILFNPVSLVPGDNVFSGNDNLFQNDSLKKFVKTSFHLTLG